MSFWTYISDALGSISRSAPVQGVMEGLVSFLTGVPNTPEKRQVAFTIAMVALGAKMAKADGVVTKDEVAAFQKLFKIPDEERASVARMFNLAKQDVAGYEAYANQIAKIYEDDDEILSDVVDGLFHIAAADGVIHEDELVFLQTVSEIFALEAACFQAIKARHIEYDASDPYQILNAERTWDNAQIKAHYRGLVKDNHPDRLIARGVPPEFLAIANEKLAAFNAAYDAIEKERGL